MKANSGESFIQKEDLLFWHGLMLLWFKDLMNVTEKLQFIDPTFRHSCLVPS